MRVCEVGKLEQKMPVDESNEMLVWSDVSLEEEALDIPSRLLRSIKKQETALLIPTRPSRSCVAQQ